MNLEESLVSRILELDWCPPVSLAPASQIQNQSRSQVTSRRAVYHQSVRGGDKPLEYHNQNLFSQLNNCGHNPYITSSLTRGCVCHFQLLLVLASAVIPGSESRGTRDDILLSRIRDFLFCRLLRLAGLRWRYSTPPPQVILSFERELLYDWRFTAN
jgi:hypothetical protein